MLYDPVSQRYYAPDYNTASGDNIQDEMKSIENSSVENKDEMRSQNQQNELTD